LLYSKHMYSVLWTSLPSIIFLLSLFPLCQTVFGGFYHAIIISIYAADVYPLRPSVSFASPPLTPRLPTSFIRNIKLHDISLSVFSFNNIPNLQDNWKDEDNQAKHAANCLTHSSWTKMTINFSQPCKYALSQCVLATALTKTGSQLPGFLVWLCDLF
jgi:hypothetical protein